jgi:branched-chain amino acid transport system substrate-binding protein
VSTPFLRRAIAVAAIATVSGGVLAACGDDDDSGSSGSNSGSGSSSGEESSPATLAFLWEVPGDSANAIPDFDNGAQIAVDEINAAGGVLGQPLEVSRTAISVADPQAARATFLEAVEGEPSGIIGIPFGAPGYARDLTAAEIPMIMASTEPQLAKGAEAGSDYIYLQEPSSAESAAITVEYAHDELGAESVAILSTDDNFGHSNSDNAKAKIEELGLDLVSEQYVPTTTTDVTTQLLALNDPDVLLTYEFPNIQALTLRQLAENDITTPVVTTSGAQLVVYNGLVEGSQIGDLQGVNPCSPTPESTREPAAEFATKYQEEFGTLPSAKAALTHDSVHLMVLAIEAAGSATDHAAINEELANLSWDGGSCQPEYQSDGAHFLSHQQVMSKFTSDGAAVEEKTYTITEQEELGG